MQCVSGLVKEARTQFEKRAETAQMVKKNKPKITEEKGEKSGKAKF